MLKSHTRLLLLIFLFFLRTVVVAKLPADTLEISKKLVNATDKLKTNTGIYLLENGGESLAARLWLFDNAQRSIDLQYYSYSKDITGLIVSDHLLRAADRGVKIRILLDDAASKMYSHEIETLDAHENVEVRVYNTGLMLGRVDKRLLRFFMNINRLLRRMHNKTFTVDGQICVMGGRNIADEYFDYDEDYNFRDRDVLLLGQAVGQVLASFDKFWNDQLTVSYAELKGKHKHRNYPKRIARLHEDAARSKEFTEQTKARVNGFPELVRTTQPGVIWVPQVSFVSDIPGKNKGIILREGGVCLDSMVEIIRAAKTSIDIQSPYFIVTKKSEALLKQTLDRGVKIRLLTNSLASTDICESFAAYKKNRKALLRLGIEVYEFKPDAAIRYKQMIPDRQSQFGYKGVYGFHSKTLVIDASEVVIGSYNFDPRSANYNTECFSVIRSATVAKNVTNYFAEELLPENSWKISPGNYPDKKAKNGKRIKAFLSTPLPRKII